MPGRSTRPKSRREFLKCSAGLGLAIPLAIPFAAPTIISASSLGTRRRPAPSERIVIGCIGVGGMGMHNLRTFIAQNDVQVVAVCDVETKSNYYHGGTVAGREPAHNAVNEYYSQQGKSGPSTGHCEAHTDFRELLERSDLDAVVVATPDHWHALVSIAAANAGKDVYCEKPLANSIGEGRAIVNAVEKNKRILQVGSHERSGDNARFAAELVRAGRIGKLHTMRVNMPCSESHHQAVRRCTGFPPPLSVPMGFDYDRWLGPAAEADYTPQRCHFWWRFILAYGGGEMTDRGAHVIDLAQLGAARDDTGPTSIVATGVANPGSLYDSFFDYRFENQYADGLRLIGGIDEPRGVKFEGSDGWIFVHVHGGKLEASNPSLLQEKLDDGATSLGRSPGHHRNFLDCVKSRQQPIATAEIGHRTATICHLNNIAMRLQRPLTWDPVKEQIAGDDEANALVSPPMRPPWSI